MNLDAVDELLQTTSGASVEIRDVVSGIQARLKEGLDVHALTEGKGVHFEIQEEQLEAEEENDNFGKDNAEPMPESEVQIPFEELALKMEDVTADGDRGVLKRVLRQGFGDTLPADSIVKFHACGRLEDESDDFDNSYLRGHPFNIHMASGELIEGLQIGLSTMKIGEISHFLIKPSYAFGRLGVSPRIPESETVLYKVEVLDAAGENSRDIHSVPRERRRDIPITEVIKTCANQRDIGNELFKMNNFGAAARKYDKAIRLLEEWPLKDEEAEKLQQRQLIKLYTNLAMTKFRMNKYAQVISCCRRALDIQETAKPYYYMGSARAALNDFQGARNDFRKGLRLKPYDVSLTRAQQNVAELEKEYKQSQKDLYRRMMAVSQVPPISAAKTTTSGA